MGIANAKVSLKNPRKPELNPIESDALADSGAVHLCIPEHIRIQLELDEIDKKEVTLADGSRKLVSYVGPIEIHFKNRVGFAGGISNGRSGFARGDTDGRYGFGYHPKDQNDRC